MTEILNSEEYTAALFEGGVFLITQPSSCAPCRALKPHWEDLQIEFADTGINFYTVNVDHVISDGDINWFLGLGVRSVPELFVYDPIKGTVPLAGRTKAALKDQILEALDNEPPL